MSSRVALATCADFPELAEGDPMLLAQLRASGIDAFAAVWDDPEVDWDACDLVVLRSTWDYVPSRDRFLSWARSLPRVLNSADVVAWNTDKRYLASLPHAVPTRFLDHGEPLEAPDGEYVIKPTISAGSRDTARYRPAERARAEQHAGELTRAGRTVMVQPYLADVDSAGETALIYFAGVYSHSIRKGQLLAPGARPTQDIYAAEEITPREPSPVEREVAEDVLDSLVWPRAELLYSRVDLIPDAEGRPWLIELELTEPSLFLTHAVGAAERLAREIARRL